MSDSPIVAVLRALDELDAAAAVAMMAPEATLLTADGRRADGRDAVRDLLAAFVSELHATSHRIVEEWHPEGVWIAEVVASYELRDRLELRDLPRVFIARAGPLGVTDLRVYGAHERPLAKEESEDARGLRLGGRWMPPL